MSVLKELSQEDGWIEVEPAGDQGGANTVGLYDGEPVNYGFKSSDDGAQLNGDEYHEYQSGPYTVEVRVSDDDSRLVRVSEHDISERTFTTQPSEYDGRYFELNIPAPLARHLGWDEVVETGSRTVQGEEVDVERGIPVELSVNWNEGGIELTLDEADSEDLDKPNVRRIQHKDVRQYKQYYIYLPSASVTALGIAGEKIQWQAGENRVVGLVPRDGTADVATNRLATAEVLDRNYWVETFPDDPRSKDTVQAGDLEVAIRETDQTYADTDYDERVISINTRGKDHQMRLLFRGDHSRALGLIPNRKAEFVTDGEKPQGAWLVEWTPEGFVVVLHLAPETLPENRVGANVVTLSINNWKEKVDPSDGVEERFEKAGNQIGVNFPKDIGYVTGLADQDVYWWPAEDIFYNSGEPILLGRRADEVPEE